MKDVEIEITVQIEKSDSLKKFLEENAEFKKEKHQIGEYFSPVLRNFIGVCPIKEWLRLGNENEKYSINYKNWHYDEQGGKLLLR